MYYYSKYEEAQSQMYSDGLDRMCRSIQQIPSNIKSSTAYNSKQQIPAVLPLVLPLSYVIKLP